MFLIPRDKISIKYFVNNTGKGEAISFYEKNVLIGEYNGKNSSI